MILQNALSKKATNLSIGSPKSNKHVSPVKELANVLVDGAAVCHIKSKTAQLLKLNATTAIKKGTIAKCVTRKRMKNRPIQLELNANPSRIVKMIHTNLKDIKPTKMKLRGVTGTDMKAIGSLTMKVTCNGETHHSTIIITELGTELILGLYFCHTFYLIHIADSCVLRSITSDLDAVHITEESD